MNINNHQELFDASCSKIFPGQDFGWTKCYMSSWELRYFHECKALDQFICARFSEFVF